jgi:hypothetical protein
MTLIPSTILPTVNERVDLHHTSNPEYPPLVEYKFIFYKYPKPIYKNITSIQVMLLDDILPNNTGLYISLYANFIQLTTPIRIYPNKSIEMVQFSYIPSQMTPEYQFQLVATIENMYLLNAEGDETAPPSNDLNIHLQVSTKYSLFNDTQSIDKLLIHHKHENKTMVLRNGKLFCSKSYI